MPRRSPLILVLMLLISISSIAQTHLSSIGGIGSLPVRSGWSPRNGRTIAFQLGAFSFNIIEAKTGRVVRLETGRTYSSHRDIGSIYALPSSTADTTYLIRQNLLGTRTAQLIAIETSTGRDLFSLGPFTLYSGSLVVDVQFDLQRQVLSLLMCRVQNSASPNRMTGYYNIDLRDRTIHETRLDSMQWLSVSRYQKVIPSILDIKASKSQLPIDAGVICRMGHLAVLSSKDGEWKTALYDTVTRSVIFTSPLQYLAADKDQFVLIRPGYMSVRLGKKYGLMEIYRWKNPTTLYRSIHHAIDDQIANDQTSGSTFYITAGRYVTRIASIISHIRSRAFDLVSGRQSSVEIEQGGHVSYNGVVVKLPGYGDSPVIKRYSFDGIAYDETKILLGSPSILAVQGSTGSLYIRSLLTSDYGISGDCLLYDARITDNRYEPRTSKGQTVPRTQYGIVNMAYSSVPDSVYLVSFMDPIYSSHRPDVFMIVQKSVGTLNGPSRVLYKNSYGNFPSGWLEWRNLTFDPFHERVIEIYNSQLVFKESDTTTTHVVGIPRSFMEVASIADSGRFLCSDSAVIRLQDRRIIQGEGWAIYPLSADSKWAIVTKGVVYGLADISLDRVLPIDTISLTGGAHRSPYQANGMTYMIDTSSTVYEFDTSGTIRVASRLEDDTLRKGIRYHGFSQNNLYAKATDSVIITWDLRSGRKVQHMSFPVNSSTNASISPADGRIIIRRAGSIFWGQAPVVTTVQEEQKPPIDLRSKSTNMRMVSREELLTELNLNGDMTLFDLQGRELSSIHIIATPSTIVVRKGDTYTLTLLIDP